MTVTFESLPVGAFFQFADPNGLGCWRGVAKKITETAYRYPAFAGKPESLTAVIPVPEGECI